MQQPTKNNAVDKGTAIISNHTFWPTLDLVVVAVNPLLPAVACVFIMPQWPMHVISMVRCGALILMPN